MIRDHTSRGSHRMLVVGLGNPEDEYGGTRHNLGADAVRLLARRHQRSLDRNKRIRAEVAEIELGAPTSARAPEATSAGDRAATRLALVIPMGYMNLSGGPARAAARWFDVPVEDIIVVHDEIDLPVGQLRVKRGGGNAGHNGLGDLDRALGSREYLRVRIGAGRPLGRRAGRDHVLRRPSTREREVLDIVLEHAADAVESLATEGLAATQNRVNGLDVTAS